MAPLSADQVASLAPDASAVSAGRKLGKPGPWKNLGQSARALWGECQGSALYQTQVAVLDHAAKCSCPSRKFPCKHALGLLFLMADLPSAFPSAAEPEWVDNWLAKRGLAQQKKEARAQRQSEETPVGQPARSAAPAQPIDVAAQAKRAEKRHQNVLAGIEQLEVWLSDLVRRGLGTLPSDGPVLWDAQARRLVDAQAPGLASRVRSIGTRVGVGEKWAERVLGELGQLSLLAHAYRRIEALPPLLAHDVRRLVGYNLDQKEVLAHGDLVEDTWVVASTMLEDDERLRVQRSWLVGEASGRTALVLQFAAGTARFSEVLVVGTAFRAKIAFWPGSNAVRGLIAERLSAAEPGRTPSHGRTIAEALDGYATGLARDPWLGRTLVLLSGVRMVRGGIAQLVDRAGEALVLRGQSHDVLWAVSGGHPVLVAAEWDGFELDALAVFSEGRAVPLPSSSDLGEAA